jgi:phage terminase large subunit GpA-like protein
MLAVTDPTVNEITVMGPTQLLKTELINNIVGYFISQDAAPMIVMQPSQSMAEAWSKDRLDKMIRDTPVLSELVKSKKSRDSDNTIYHKSFPGGHITVVWPTPSQVASRPVRIVLKDEVDKYESTKEGDAASLIDERTATFWNALRVNVCSPTIKGNSRIEAKYLNSDQRKFFVDCPHCKHTQFMVWDNVKWINRDAKTAHYICPECTVAWTEKDRRKAISGGRYIATAPFNGHAGFLVNKLASPWETVQQLVQKWIDSQGDIEKIKVFVNTQLAEVFEEEGESPDYIRLYERRERYDINTLPKGVTFLTAGCDVQKDRLEVSIYGWGRNRQSWLIDHRVLMGQTHTDEPWKQLDEILNESWAFVGQDRIQIRTIAVDSGFNTQHVYNWARRHPSSRVMVIKGNDKIPSFLGTPSAVDVNFAGKKINNGIQVWQVGTNKLKEELYSWLNLDGAGDDGIYPPGYCFFPQMDQEFFRQLTAEALITSKVSGKTKTYWKKIYERNEALDCRNYARAAANRCGWDRMTEDTFKLNEGYVPETPKEKPPQRSDQTKIDHDLDQKSKLWDNPRHKLRW